MAYERTKTIYGRQYRYLVRGRRIAGKVRQEVVKYLGPVDAVYKRRRQRRSNAWTYVRELSDEEIGILAKAARSNDSFKRDRARIILMSAQRIPPSRIAEKVCCEIRKVWKAVKAFDAKGTAALERGKAKGAKPKFSAAQRAEILRIASTEPKLLGLHFTTWSLPKLERYLRGRGMSVSMETIRRILRSSGMRLRKSKRFQYSNDPNFVKKNSA